MLVSGVVSQRSSIRRLSRRHSGLFDMKRECTYCERDESMMVKRKKSLWVSTVVGCHQVKCKCRSKENRAVLPLIKNSLAA